MDMHLLQMTIERSDPGIDKPVTSRIVVDVVHDDGYVSYATLMDSSFRCWVNTAERRAHWEVAHSGQWCPVVEDTIHLEQQLRIAMHRAAAAGLVACGACSQRC